MRKTLTVSKIIGTELDHLLRWSGKLAVSSIHSDLAEAKLLDALNWDKIAETAVNKFMDHRDERAVIGSRVHELIHDIVKQPKSGVPLIDSLPWAVQEQDEVDKCVRAFYKWYLDSPYESIHSELDVHSEKYKFRGRADCFARDAAGQTCVLDFKVKAGSFPPPASYATQLAAYALAYNEMHGLTDPKAKNYCAFGVIVQLGWSAGDESAKITHWKVTNMEEMTYAFHCQNILARLHNEAQVFRESPA